jgi:hypothetical protein
MFFRRKVVTLASLDERLSLVEIALQIRREEPPPPSSGRLQIALARLQSAMLRDAAKKRLD